jgi:hypothetical protein
MMSVMVLPRCYEAAVRARRRSLHSCILTKDRSDKKQSDDAVSRRAARKTSALKEMIECMKGHEGVWS